MNHSITAAQESGAKIPQIPPRRSRLRRLLRWGLFGFLGFLLLGTAAFFILNATGRLGDAVEIFRRITGEPGTRFVAWAEEIYFETRYDLLVWWRGEDAGGASSEMEAKPLVVSPSVPKETPQSQPEISQARRPPAGDIPWSPYLHADGSASGIYTAQIFPNPRLRDEPVYLAWVDATQIAFHWVPGTVEPEGEPDGPLDRSGLIPEAHRDKVVAAFNGGYLSKHGRHGAMFEGTTVLPPLPGRATAVIKKDGSIQIGEWGRDILPKDPDVVTFRQNLRLIVDGGEIPKDIGKRSKGAIRPVVTEADPLGGDLKAHTWRSGIGITSSGDLIFAAGDFLDGPLLAESLRAAGAERAMQLDVNAPYFCVFLLFEPDGQGGLETLVLGPKMTPREGQFLTTRSQKDFVYLTRR